MTRSVTIGSVVLTALACAALVWFLRMGWLQLAAVAKLVASSGFVLTALSVRAHRHRFGQLVLAGLALSLVGDLLLIGQSRRFFLMGLGAFLAAHIIYSTAFIGSGQNRRWAYAAGIPVFIVAALVLTWLSPQVPAALTWPVRFYTVVIGVMVVTAFGAKGAGAPALLAIGALMFFVSDLSVAMQRIVETPFPTIIWGLPLYYAAQLCFAVGAAHSSSQ